MNTLLAYLGTRYPSILFFIAQNMVNHLLIQGIQFAFMDIRVPIAKRILCALTLSLLYLAPIYLVDCFFFQFGQIHQAGLIYSMLMFITPISAVAYYFVLKRALKLSSARTSIILRNHILIHNIVVLLYMFSNDTLLRFMEPWLLFHTGVFYNYEAISILIIIVLLVIARIIVNKYIRRTNRFITIPPNYIANKKSNIMQTSICLCAFYAVIILFRYHCVTNSSDPIGLTNGFIYVLLVALMFMYLLLSNAYLRIKIKNWEIQSTGTYISSLLRNNQEFRAIKHDFYNILQAYGGYLEIGDYEKLKAYHRSLFSTTRLAGDLLSLIDVLKSRIAVYKLIEEKLRRADECGVLLSINTLCDITGVVMPDIDLCRLLGIVFDNSIEAATASETKQINLSIERKNPETTVFILSNTTNGDVDTARIFDYGYTTKEGHSGVGLPQAQHIINAYEHCTLRVNSHDGQFTVFLILHTAVNTQYANAILP